ncbi:MAG: L,D-transpeptidase [Pseudomonadota bacterium]|nr:L,D-transpeptidase [Pseudomonadota bacterium]
MFTSVSLALLATAVAAQTSEAIGNGPADKVLAVQVMLDRERHSPGVIDGRQGGNTRRAVAAFEKANGLRIDGKIDPEVMRLLEQRQKDPLLQDYVIAEADVAGLVEVPAGMEAQSKLDTLGFETALEALAEKFHMSQDLMRRLNPGVEFSVAGNTIRVVKPGSNDGAARVARIEVDKAVSELRALDADGRLVASYPATIGSETFPSPSGSMEVRAIAPAPKYYFDPKDHPWGPDKRLTIAAGPNNPVGSTWIDLTKDGYGIHGTPEPRLIGKTPSHGCVRLTNWDAQELSRAVAAGTAVVFVG